MCLPEIDGSLFFSLVNSIIQYYGSICPYSVIDDRSPLFFLQFKLEDAIDDEDFQEAARLKGVLSKTNDDDPVCVVLTELKVEL